MKAELDPTAGQHPGRQAAGSGCTDTYCSGELNTRQKVHLSDLANGLGAGESMKTTAQEHVGSWGPIPNVPDIVPEVNKICLRCLIHSFNKDVLPANSRLRWQVGRFV